MGYGKWAAMTGVELRTASTLWEAALAVGRGKGYTDEEILGTPLGEILAIPVEEALGVLGEEEE